jgi:thiamine-phosphate pyrophosphorylase
MASAEERANLAIAAARLNAGHLKALACAPHFPALILMTDEKRLPDPVAAARALPKGSAVIVRALHDDARRRLAEALAPLARERELRLLVANDAKLAERAHADGLHLSEANARAARAWRASHPHWLITAAAHSAHAVAVAAAAGADAALLSPVFTTLSHPGHPALGSARFLAIAREAAIPVYALGGVTAANAALIEGPNVAGIAAIQALTPG